MFEWIWECMILSFKAGLGFVFWMFAVCGVAGLIGGGTFFIAKAFSDGFRKPERKEPEDPKEWAREQLKEIKDWEETWDMKFPDKTRKYCDLDNIADIPCSKKKK